MTNCKHSWYTNLTNMTTSCAKCGEVNENIIVGKSKPQLTTLQAYHLACNELLSDFIKIYFCDEDIGFDDVHHFWAGGDIGAVVFINDYFFNMTDIADAIDLMIEKESLFEWYEQWTDPKKRKKINLKTWILFTRCLQND